MDNTAFSQAYDLLNDSQRKAVDAIEGPVMVIAGPGTGKTQILALRIANILEKTDTKPENILALTFTDAGSHAMKERLRRYIGDAAYRVAVHTFHSFAGQLIVKYPDAYPTIIGGRAATDIERFSIIEDIVNDGNLKELRPNGDPLYYVKKIPGAISDLKKEYVTPDEFAGRLQELETRLLALPKFHEKGAHKGKVRSSYAKEEKRLHKLLELNYVYRQYQQVLKDRHIYDFEDMIVETVGALEGNEEMLRDLQETYQYILADEHQDVNESQNKILELLAHFHDKPNIFVVGDEKQSIYRFQGASLDNFLFFEDKFPGTEMVQLVDNYRSTQAILNIAHALIKSDDPELAKLRVPLKAAGEVNSRKPSLSAGRQECRRFSHEAVEDDWLVGEVKKLQAGGVPAEEIAIIVRYNRDVEHIAGRLRTAGLDVRASAESDILDHPVTKAAEDLMLASLEVGNETALFAVLTHCCWAIESGDLSLVLAARSYKEPLRRLIYDEEKLRELGVVKPEKIRRVGEVLDKARTMSSTKAPHFVLQYLLKESGLLASITKDDPSEGVRVLRRLYDDIESMVREKQATTVAAVVNQLKYRRTHNLSLIAPYIDTDQTAIQVMTAHKSKGLEFHTVFLPRATDNAFGKADKRDYFKLPLGNHQIFEDEGEEDDRRLLYVAITRAKVNLLVSSAENTTGGKICEPTRFLYQMEDKAFVAVGTKDEEETFRPEAILEQERPSFCLNPADIKHLFLARGLSVTHLNNYLEDPRKYYLENLLRQPQPQSLSAMKGNAVHEILDRAVSGFVQNGKWMTINEANTQLQRALERMPIGTNDLTRLHENALQILSGYLPRLGSTVAKSSRPEMSLRVVLKTNDEELPEIPLTGKIDRLDFNEDGQVIRVTDYKTGKPKSRNDVEGNTKSSNGNYKRQLVFYALLLELYGMEVKSPEFILSFVEPKERSGEIVEHSFSVTKEEVVDLKREIIRVSKEIISGEKFAG
ncbi:MAG: ATP-dependent DNA helicase [Candidatus Paceibacterota bacterium]